ncbi:hypothetical protein BDN72DRAFT_819113 [Pluteus cervinus]|uniref:Uncharacterized protein n=1 Tax=Pluteus cervinus TaxID=181527 RepID=A0ACD3AXY5_9AGAR|nr:hypothetical protein BDN72DRAFT_819113 [Pluteus cervinus]
MSESTSTLSEYLQSQDDLLQEASLALPHSFSECTYDLGPLRQAVYLCLTCSSSRGICSACSIACHTNHEQLELFPKRNFRCDCPTTSIEHSCTLHPKKEVENTTNQYGQNFKGVFCRCSQPYHAEKERETMIQCLSCEDWFHESCCNLRKRPPLRGETPEAEKTVREQETSDGDDAESDISSSSLPPALVSSLDYEAFVCGSCVTKIPILRKSAGCHGFIIVYRESLDEEWIRLGDSANGPVDVENLEEQPMTGSKRRLSTPPEGEPNGKRPRPSSPIASANCLAPPPNPVAQTILSNTEDPNATTSLGTGDLFLTEGFRERWCHCNECSAILSAHPYLLKEEDTYEPPEDPDSALSFEELGLRALSRIPRDRAIDGIHAFNQMRDRLVNYLRPFAQQGKTVNESDVTEFFDSLQEKTSKGS